MSADKLWFKGAGLGIFIHWGISSAAAIQEVDLSWGMMKNKPWFAGYTENTLPPERYWELAGRFGAERYEPDKWLAAAREAGARYAVLTTRHHDGYALWPSEHGTFSTKQHLNGRDLVGEFVDACRRQGLRAGLYYSLSDWKHMDAFYPGEYANFEAFMNKELEPADLVRFERYFMYVKGQIHELITCYGKIDLFWFDHSLWNGSLDERMDGIYALIRRHQPGILINDRGGEHGDFRTPECAQPNRRMAGLWESCYIWQNGGWGYDPREDYRDMDWTLERLAATVGGGGNLLLNVGPKADGTFPDVVYERLNELSAWMKHSGSSVLQTDAADVSASLPVTRRENVYFLHVPRGCTGDLVVNGIGEPVSSIQLRTGQAVSYDFREGALRIAAADIAVQSGDEVVAITVKRAGAAFENEVFQFERETGQ